MPPVLFCVSVVVLLLELALLVLVPPVVVPLFVSVSVLPLLLVAPLLVVVSPLVSSDVSVSLLDDDAEELELLLADVSLLELAELSLALLLSSAEELELAGAGRELVLALLVLAELLLELFFCFCS